MSAPWYMRLISVLLFLPALALAEVDYQSFPHLIPEINTFTGAANHNIPIAVPPGRNGIQPELAFTYSSYRQTGMIAKGWEIPVDFIQRRTKRGVHYDQDEFDFHDKHGKVELVEISGMPNNYRARIETDFSRYQFFPGGNYWRLTHRDGTQYYFGYYPVSNSSGSSRQTNAHGTFKWCLAQVQDPNGNYMTIEYFEDQGRIYPSRFDYTGNSNTSLSPTSSVVFEYETGERPDPRISYASKSMVKTAKRLAGVKTYALLPSSGETMALAYGLEYDQSTAGRTSLLSKIRIVGTDGVTQLPGYSFAYSRGSIGTLAAGPSTSTIPLKGYELSAFADIDGDNRDDFYISGCVYNGNGDGTFANQGCTQTLDHATEIYFADLNADGNSDLIKYIFDTDTDSDGTSHVTSQNLRWYLSTGNGSFTLTQTISLLRGYINPSATPGPIALLDYNNDGYVDIYKGERLFISDGAGQLASEVSSTLPEGYRYLADVNGDGLTDSCVVGNDPFIKEWYTLTRLSRGNGTFESGGRKTILLDYSDVGPFDWQSYTSIVKARFADVNNDQLADLVVLAGNRYSRRKVQVFLADGQGGFAYLAGYEDANDAFRYRIPRMVDLNGDGQMDFADLLYSEREDSETHDIIVTSNVIKTFLSQNAAPFDLLTEASSPGGVKLTYTYRLASEIQNHHHLPFVVHTVKSVELDDGVRSDHPRSTFRHELGFYDPSEREFRGFEEATQTHPDQTVTRTYHFVGPPPGFVSPSGSTFHADDNYYYKGRVRQVDQYAQADGALLSSTVLTWGKSEQAADPWAFVRLTGKQTTFYDDQTVFAREDYLYDVDFDGLADDTAGLLRQKTNSGSGAGAVVTAYGYENYHSTWDPMWRKTEETVYDDGQSGSPARHTRFIYNGTTGNLEQKIGVNTDPDAADSVWRYQYDGNGNLQYEYDANGNPPTRYVSYDATEIYPTLIRNPLGHETQKQWDTRWGLEDWVADPNGQTTAYTYDAFGRLTGTDFPDQGYTRLIYSDYCTGTDCTNVGLPRQLGVEVRTVGSRTEDTLFHFDGLGRKVQTAKTGEAGNYVVTRLQYDNMGRAGLEAGPFFHSSNAFQGWDDYSTDGYTPVSGLESPYVYTLFDQRGRPYRKTSPDGQNGLAETTYAYSGFETTVTDPDGCVKTEIRDHLDRIREVVEDPSGEDIHTHYSYNAAGDLLTVYNAAEPTASLITIQYDSLGRKIRMDDPDMGQWTYAYYPNGELELQTDAKGSRIQYFYDDLNRLETKDYLDTGDPTVAYTYDSPDTFFGVGRLSSISNGAVTTVITAYDPMGRQTEMQKTISGAAARTMSWDYDYAGRVQRLTYPHTGASPLFYVDYAFHPGTGLLHTATGPDGTVYATMTGYQPSGKIGTLDFGNNVRTTYGYDSWSQRLTSIATAKDQGAGNKHQDRLYSYSKAGDIEQIDDQAWVETYYYSYDKLHRLTSETTSTGSLGVIPGIYEMQYDDPDHIHAASGVITRGAAYDYTYDPNGNMTAGPDLTDIMAVVRRGLTFNADNMPATVAHPTGGTVTITYDGEAKRAKKSGPNGTTYYFSNEFEQIGATETCYVFAGNLRVAMVKDHNNVTYFHKDHLGSSSVVTDANGDALEQTRYMPFGGKRGDGAGILASNYLFTDQELDKASGLYNYDARLYDPIVGRFVSADSIVPKWFRSQMLNRYAYSLNNPIKYTDPSGHEVAIDNSFGNFVGDPPSQADAIESFEALGRAFGIGTIGGGIMGGTAAFAGPRMVGYSAISTTVHCGVIGFFGSAFIGMYVEAINMTTKHNEELKKNNLQTTPKKIKTEKQNTPPKSQKDDSTDNNGSTNSNSSETSTSSNQGSTNDSGKNGNSPSSSNSKGKDTEEDSNGER